ncbi:MAG TPA: hypothetical protein VMZ27_15950 [Candidatus Saccharimonadales bacterium]|nr:hypothetical protein [Candidatus Saccharimonadales bacterium]
MERIPPGQTLSPTQAGSLWSPVLTKQRMWAAVAVAMVADAIQMGLGPIGMVGIDQGIDLVAALVTIGLLGFHPLLLPTFLIELIPVADMLPTWTGCVLLVIAMRKRSRASADSSSVIIDVPPKVIDQPPQLPDKQG